MRVGIVIPSFNQGEYLEKTILSVIKNKSHCEIDIALIDGGSTDNSIDIIEKYKDYLYYWCSELDSGQAEAINKGLKKLSHCDYFMWLNSDDEFYDEFSVKKIVEYAMINSYDVCYGKSLFIDSKGDCIGEYPTETYSYKRLASTCYISQPSVMFSKKALEFVGGLNEKLCMCLDYELWIRMSKKFEFGYINEFIGNTRMYEGTKTSKQKKVHLREGITILWNNYHKVPMNWIVTYYLDENPNSVLRFLPKRLLFVILLSSRKKIINQVVYNKGQKK